MRTARALWVLLVAGFAALSLKLWVVAPYRCNIEIRSAQIATVQALQMPPLRRSALARKNVEEMKACLQTGHGAVNAHMILAANLRMLNRPEEAIVVYRRALEFDRRSEIFLNLGRTYLEVGRPDEAKDAFLQAARFDVDTLWRVPDPNMAHELSRALHSEVPHLWE
jgi:tetratricopeptide (TPR) repeat protein